MLASRIGLMKVLVVVTAILAGCVTTTQQTGHTLPKDEGARRIIVLPPDVELSILHAGGVEEPNAEWTRNARKHIADDLAERFRRMNVALVNGDRIALESAGDSSELQLLKLHEVVGASILNHQYQGPRQLPTKVNSFDWSLGPETRHLATKHGGDYALFVFVRDSYSSDARIATMIIAAAFGVGIQGGTQIGYASLVDLRSGDVVWFNLLARATGDLRTAEAVQETVNLLLANFPQ
ncbi:MAG: hypothetical protein GEU76_13015 [Alphaproteobacteria bacterium]|nr:hypothetical protein [Alphaproteobacteria bacterium]